MSRCAWAGVSYMGVCGVGRPSRDKEKRPGVRHAVLVLRLRPHRRPAITDAKGIPGVAHVEGVVVVALDGSLARADSAPREVYQVLRLEYTLTPDLHYQTVKGALLLSPSPPRIAPSQLRLVDAG